MIDHFQSALRSMPSYVREGEVSACNGLVIEAIGPDAHLGEVCELWPTSAAQPMLTQVIGFRDGRVLLMPYGSSAGLRVGDRLRASGRSMRIPVGPQLLGRVIDAFGVPLDGKGGLVTDTSYDVHRAPIAPLQRREDDTVLETGIRVIDTLLTMGKGQRMGVFAGSGVGKSTLLGMMARHVKADVAVIGLIGERGREVGDFVAHALGEGGMQRAVVIAATSDQPALVRTHAAHAVAEYFRDQGNDVLLMVDSITRFAMAQREIGLAAGEPPTSRGYPPSVFNTLPQLIERGGALKGKGSVSCVYSVLVEGDDMNEPVADHMRALLDGHIVLSRDMAHRGQLPAIDPLQSVSRWIGRLTTSSERADASDAKALLATFDASRDLIDMGAYQRGSNENLDRAVERVPALLASFRQPPHVSHGRAEGYTTLASILHGHGGAV
ncbi:FliI/YscN family ATPase [Dyella silvatica]|uniref:FliI/YscN family ATPase n=1 Tax=Dyella silvatica TaxID=2992128 RepID=UPI00225AF89D|nr:FliI/YscN family ATPase [Dyella silvatica]